MDAISSIAPGATGALGTGDAFSELTSKDFVRIMFTELSNQDPLAPNESKDLLAQMSSLRSIEADMDLEETLGTVASHQQFAAASGLIGEHVTGLTADLQQRVSGLVASVRQSTDGPVLRLDTGAFVPFANVEELTLATGTAGEEGDS